MAGIPPDVVDQWEEIKGLSQYWKTISGALTPVFVALPLAGLFVEFFCCPSYEKVEPILASVFALLIVILLYYSFRKTAEGRIAIWAKFLFCGGLLWFFIHILLLVLLTAVVDDERHLMGFTLSEKAQTALANKEITSTSPKALLTYFGYESEDDAWSYRWLATISLILTNMATFSSLAGGLFLFTLKSFVHDKSNQPIASC